MTRCRDCALYDLQAVLSAKGRVLPSRVAQCLWVSTEIYPKSITRFSALNYHPKSGWMEPNEGDGCPTFVAVVKP